MNNYSSVLLSALLISACSDVPEHRSEETSKAPGETGIKATVNDGLAETPREFRGEVGEVRVLQASDGGLGSVTFQVSMVSGDESLITAVEIDTVEELVRLREGGVPFAVNRVGLNHVVADASHQTTYRGSMQLAIDRSHVRGELKAEFPEGSTISATFAGQAPQVSCWFVGAAEGLVGFDEVAPPVSYRPAPLDEDFCREARAVLDLGGTLPRASTD